MQERRFRAEAEFGLVICNYTNRDMARTHVMSAVQSFRMTEFTDWRSRAMQGKVKEEWMELCEQAAVEQDTNRLIELVRAINTMLEKKEERLARERAARGET